MSGSKPLLHGSDLLTALTETAAQVLSAGSLDATLSAAAAGFEVFGAQVVVVATTPSSSGGLALRLHYLSPAIQALHARVTGTSELGLMQQHTSDSTSPVLVTDFSARARAWVESRGQKLAGLEAFVPDRCALAPLKGRTSRWGTLVIAHDDLTEDDLPALRLFALQLSAAIQVREELALVDRRTVELDLVHDLALAGPEADAKVLCARALETVCRTSQSDVGVLHRFDRASNAYVMVGDAFGYQGRLVEQYRRFSLTAANPLAHRAVALPSRQLPTGGAAVLAEGLQHFAVVPLFSEGKPFGMLSLARRTDQPYTAEAVRSAEILGVQMAAVLERARLHDEAGRLYGDLKVSYDELARTQQELVRHERLAALGELAAVMAHEVRNPLGVIFNSLTTLKRLLRPSGDAEMLLNMVGEEADRLNRIVGDLLDFVRPYELVKKPMAIEPIISGAVDSATAASIAPNVRVVTEFPKELPPFPIDAHLVKQALVNLLLNAAQAMPKGGTVTVRATVELENGTPWLTVRVRDEGVGLSDRATARMFQPFFTTKATGTGLGLAVVKRIVDAHLGDVSARPNESGKGTTFIVRFPPTTESRSALTPPRPSPAVR